MSAVMVKSIGPYQFVQDFGHVDLIKSPDMKSHYTAYEADYMVGANRHEIFVDVTSFEMSWGHTAPEKMTLDSLLSIEGHSCYVTYYMNGVKFMSSECSKSMIGLSAQGGQRTLSVVGGTDTERPEDRSDEG